MRFLFFIRVLIPAVLLVVGHFASAQDSTSETTATEAIASPIPSLEQLQATIDELAASTTIAETERDKALELHRAALSKLTEANNFADQKSLFQQAMLTAPEQTKSLQQSLSQESQNQAPVLTVDAALTALEAQLAEANARLLSLQNRLAELENQLSSQRTRPEQVPGELGEAQNKLTELQQVSLAVDSSPTVQAARATLHTIHQLSYRRQIEMLEQELASFELRLALLDAQRAVATRHVTIVAARVDRIQQLVNARRRNETAAAIRQAEQTSQQMADQPDFVRTVADENTQLSQQLAELVAQIDTISNQQGDLEQQLKQLAERYQSIRQQLDIAGLSDALGPLLRRERRELPDVGQYERGAEQREERIVDARLHQFQVEEQHRKALAINGQTISELITSHLGPTPASGRQQILHDELRALFNDRRELLEQLRSGYASYIAQLVALDQNQRDLVDSAQQYAVLLDERLFWIANANALDLNWLGDMQNALRGLLALASWQQSWQGLTSAVMARPVWAGLALLLWLWLLWQSRNLSRRLRGMANSIGNVGRDHFGFTIEAFCITLLLSLLWPLPFATIGTLLVLNDSGGELNQALGFGCLGAAFFAVVIISFRQTCRFNGLAALHLGWSERICQLLKRHLAWYFLIGIPCAFLVSMTEQISDDLYRDTVGRLAFVVGSLALAVFLAKIMHPSKGIPGDYLKQHTKLAWRLRYLWYPLIVAAPALLTVVALLGYYYTALQLLSRLFISLYWFAGASIDIGLILRWLRIEQRRLAWSRARAKREALLEARAKETDSASGEGLPPLLESDVLDLETISEQSRSLLKSHPLVLKEPAPAVLLLQFGDSSLNFEVRVFVSALADRLPITHELYNQIYAALNEHGIEIPFPQRDVHIRSGAPA